MASRKKPQTKIERLTRVVTSLQRRLRATELKILVLEKRLSAPVDLERNHDTSMHVTPDGLIMVRDVPHLVECVLVQQPLFMGIGRRVCSCGSLGAREQRRS